MKVSLVNSAGASFCWNYATNTFYSNYAGANVCCNYADIEVSLQLCCWYFLLHLFWRIFLLQLWRWLFLLQLCKHFCSKYVGDSFYWNYASGSLLQSCRWYFLQRIMQMTISIVIMQVAVSIVVMYVTTSSSNFLFLSLTCFNFSYIKFAFHHFHKYSSKIKILCGWNLYTNRLNSVLLFYW